MRFQIFIYVFIFSLGSLLLQAKDVKPELFKLSHLIAAQQEDEVLQSLKKLKRSKLKRNSFFHFALAKYHYNRKEYAEAEKIFSKLSTSKKSISHWAKIYLIKSQIAQENYAQAKKSWKLIDPRKLNDFLDPDILLVACLAKSKDTETEVIKTEKTWEWRLADARCDLAKKKKATAFQKLKEIYTGLPHGRVVKEAILLIQERFSKSLTNQDRLKRYSILKDSHLDIEAAAVMEQVYLKDKSYLSALAKAQFEARNYRQAAQLYKNLLRREVNNIDYQQKLASAYSRSDQFDLAIAAYQKIYQQNNNMATAFKLAFLEEDAGRFKKALQKYQAFLMEYPKTNLKSFIAWKSFWLNYRLKNYASALKYLAILREEYPDQAKKRGYDYWQARLHEKQGQKTQARKYYQKQIQKDAYSYYSFLARKRLKTKKLDIAAAVFMQGPQKGNLPQALNFNQMKRLKYKNLALMALWEEFIYLKSTQENWSHVLDMALKQYSNYVYNGNLNQQFPTAYGSWVVHFSQLRQIPPQLVWSIMREESRFQPTIVSASNAIGLMQVIPQTADEITMDLKRQYFQIHDLKRPMIAIDYGSHYLAKLYRKWNANLVFTIASYNAGPDAVGRWVKSRGQIEIDEFIEEIPYRETRNYVKKVLRSYYMYHLLYAN